MRKYGKWLLVLGVMAASPVAASADGFLGGRLKPSLPFSGSAEKARNQQLADDVASALKSAQVQGTEISIEVKDGVAILDGKVSEASQRSLAQRVAGSVEGIERVENNIRYIAPSGGQIERASAQADPRSSRVTQAAAFETAERRPAIQRVSGEMPAPNSKAANEAKAQQVADALGGAGLAGMDITIRVSGGVATLEGPVPTLGHRQAAEQAASQVPGIQGVNNQLQVSGPITRTGYNSGMPMMAPPEMMPQPQMMGAPQMMGGPQMMPAGYMQPQMAPGMPPTATGYAPTSFNHPNLPAHAWPSYAQYPNSAAVSYPTQYSASAWPYIGPFYPYPQVPLGWREVSLEWDDGYWQLNFNKEKDKWYWVLNPKNW